MKKNMNPDLLVCGVCQRDFLFEDIILFMNHKKFDCDELEDVNYNCSNLQCVICSEYFYSPWRLLKHAQYSHQTNIYSIKCNQFDEQIEEKLQVSEPLSSVQTKKCCLSVVPKKRKQHFELKHAYAKRELKVAKRRIQQRQLKSSNTIFIDFDSSNQLPSFLKQTQEINSCELPKSDFSKAFNKSSELPKSTNDVVERLNTDEEESLLNIPLKDSDFLQDSSSHQPIALIQQHLNSTSPKLQTKLDNSLVNNSNRTFGLEDNKTSLAENNEMVIEQNISCCNDSPKLKPNDQPFEHSNQPGSLNKSKCSEAENSLCSNSKAHTSMNEHHSITDSLENSKKRKYPTSRPYKCSECDNAFNQRIHLKKHLSKHTGIKPFKCGQCDYATVERSHLKVHIRVHTGEKPFKCTYCEYATAQNSTLKIHLKRHHGNDVGDEISFVGNETGRMYKCSNCTLYFTQIQALQSHTEKLHNCCDMT